MLETHEVIALSLMALMYAGLIVFLIWDDRDVRRKYGNAAVNEWNKRNRITWK